MANVLVEEQSLQNIANAIRAKNGLSDTYTPQQMASGIMAIQGIPVNSVCFGEYLSFTDYSYGWFTGQTVGNNISVTGTGNTDWKIIKCNIQKDKKYICKTYFSDGGNYLKFVVGDSNGNVINIPNTNNYPSLLLDTTNFDDSNGLVLYVAVGKISHGQIYNMFGVGNNVYVREVLQPTAITSLADL